jgi:protein-S-isoprenylcysteine O-methyltransferase Ste14
MTNDVSLFIVVIRWAALLSVVIWFVVYWRGGLSVLEDILSAFKKTFYMDALLMVDIAVAAFAMMVISALISLDILHQPSPSALLLLPGFALVLIGIAGTFICRNVLGEYWTAENNVLEEHHVIKDGPYRKIRHPIYSFVLLLYIGFALVFPNLWNFVALFIILVDYVLKAIFEDQYLVRYLTGYEEYRKEVPYYLIPGVW